MATTTEAPPAQPDGDPDPPPLGFGETLRWAWRQLTSMRTALVLLFLLALAAIPGSVLPQRSIDPFEVRDYLEEHPTAGEWYDRFSLFDVYSSPWFAAVYLLLLTSLVGCVVPRSRRHLAAVRAAPPPAPRNLGRLPASARWETSLPPDEALAAGRTVLRRRRFRTTGDATTVSAEKGHVSETGNLVFHVAMLGFLVAVALGSFYGFHGRVVVAEGQGFANAVSQYDDFEPGTLFDPTDLEPFVVTLDDFHATFATEGEQRGAPRSFDADVTYQRGATGEQRPYDLRVNHPLEIDGTKVFLVNHGYAPEFTVRDGNGDVAWSGPVPFLQQDRNFTSSGVVKAPDARPTQLGIEGLFLPTATVDERGPRSLFPAPRNPGVFLTAYEGDLGLDAGLPQSAYELNKDRLTQLREDGEPFRVALAPGETRRLPGGAGTVTFDGVSRWVQLDVADDPGSTVALGSAAAALAGLTASLFVRRRRVWVRVAPAASGRTVVEVGGLPRAESHGFTDEFADLGAEMRRAVPEEE